MSAIPAARGTGLLHAFCSRFLQASCGWPHGTLQLEGRIPGAEGHRARGTPGVTGSSQCPFNTLCLPCAPGPADFRAPAGPQSTCSRTQPGPDGKPMPSTSNPVHHTGTQEAGHRITPTMAAYKVAEKENWRGLKIAAAGSITGGCPLQIHGAVLEGKTPCCDASEQLLCKQDVLHEGKAHAGL